MELPQKTLVFYNGETGGLGRHLSLAFRSLKLIAVPVKTRLENFAQFPFELDQYVDLAQTADSLVFLPMAAMVSVPACAERPELAYKTNVEDTCKFIAEFAKWSYAQNRPLKIVYPSSSHVYKAINQNTLIAEDCEVLPRSVYAETKLACENQLAVLSAEYGFHLVIARIFGVIGPGQPKQYVLPGLIDRVRQKRFTDIPGLDNIRDYLDAREICSVLAALANHREIATQPSPLIVNVCSSKGVSIRQLMHEILQASFGESWWHYADLLTAAPGRKDDIVSMVGSNSQCRSLIQRDLGLTPLSLTVSDALNH